MSRYPNDRNLVATQGQDFAFQIWTTDNRSEPVPFTIPAKMTVKDKVGQDAFETSEDTADAGIEALILTSPLNGLIQVTIPRAVLAELPAGTYLYDVWATIVDEASTALFPGGQLVPVSSGRFIVRSRTTVMEEEIVP